MCFFDTYALFTLLTFLFRNTMGTLRQEGNLFLFSLSTIHPLDKPTFSGNNGGRVYYKLVGRLQQLLGWCFNWLETSRSQASLFGEGQDGVSHHNT
jgi:hypothetical protein